MTINQASAWKELFQLDPSVVYLNHGSFGACPRSVFAAYQRWQTELERQPVEFLGRRSAGLLAEARARLGEYLGAPADTLLFFTNPTTALSMVARSLPLEPGDEILTTDQEYPATEKMWRFVCQHTGARLVFQPVPLPARDPQAIVEAIWAGVTPRTRVLFVSHITCMTALIFPIAELCRRARAAGILSVVDGAHAPAQIPLDLRKLDADLYAGACHKWFCAPKGAGFLYARPGRRDMLEPLAVSQGWDESYPDEAARFIGCHEWQGTRDISAFLSVPAAIDFQAQHDWPAQRALCHALAVEARRRLEALTGLPALCTDTPGWFGQMVSVRLPADYRQRFCQADLYDRFHIEVPIVEWRGGPLLRASFQVYNDERDIDCLVSALRECLG